MTQDYGQPGDYGTPSDPPTAGYEQAPAQYGQPPAQYGQPPAQYGQLAAGTGVLGKRRNPFAVWLLLPFITLGIYGLVWIYKTNRELSRYDSRIVVSPALSVLAFFPGALLLIPPFVAAWRIGVRVQRAQHAAGVQECSPALAFVLFWFGFGPLYAQFEINKIWDRYPGGVEGQQVPLAV